MRRTSRLARGVAAALAAAAIAVGVAACSGTDGGDDVVVDDARVNDARYTCLLDAGFAVTRTDNGGIEFVDPDDSRSADYEAALADCDAKLADEGLLPAGGDELLREEYAVLTDLRTCIEGHGYALEEWPSEDVFVEGDGAYNALAGPEEIEQERVQELCPDEHAALGEL